VLDYISENHFNPFSTWCFSTPSCCAPSFVFLSFLEPLSPNSPFLLKDKTSLKFLQILDRNLNPFSLSDFDFVMNVNVRGTIDLIRQVLPHMARTAPTAPDNERGVIIMVASSAAFDGQPGQVAYAASKGAIRSLTLPLTRDLARHGIRVVTIAPSLFDSRMTAMMSDKVRASLTRVMEFPGTFCSLFTFLLLPSSLMIVPKLCPANYLSSSSTPVCGNNARRAKARISSSHYPASA
jgi:NAD(P)-dependent dehydrogenase (short-subunit alcohol dehydrogenase family)